MGLKIHILMFTIHSHHMKFYCLRLYGVFCMLWLYRVQSTLLEHIKVKQDSYTANVVQARWLIVSYLFSSYSRWARCSICAWQSLKCEIKSAIHQWVAQESVLGRQGMELTGSPGAPAKPGAPSLPAAPCTHDRKKPVSFTAYTMWRIGLVEQKKSVNVQTLQKGQVGLLLQVLLQIPGWQRNIRLNHHM